MSDAVLALGVALGTALVVGFVVGIVMEVRESRARRGVAPEHAPDPGTDDGTDGDPVDIDPDLMGDFACDECGLALRGALGHDVVDLELTYDGEYRDVAFCSMEHAAQWMAKPLPPLPARSTVHDVDAGRDWTGVVLVVGVLAVLALAVFGAVSLVGLVF